MDLTASTPEGLMAADYELALKFFLNKDFSKSFALIRKLQSSAGPNYMRGALSEGLFVKITVLFLTEVGLLLSRRETHGAFVLPAAENASLAHMLRSGSFLNSLTEVYGSFEEIPPELLFNTFLVYHTCLLVLLEGSPRFVEDAFAHAYQRLPIETQAEPDRRFLRRWVELYIFNVLPDLGQFKEATRIAHECPLLDAVPAVAKIEEIEKVKAQQKATRAKLEAQKAEVHEPPARQTAHRSPDERRVPLAVPHRSQVPKKEPPVTLDDVRRRAQAVYAYSRQFLAEKSPLLLAGLLIVLVFGHLLRRSPVPLRDRIRDTLQMAFKVTYL